MFNITEKIDYISICIHHDHSNAHQFVQLKKKSGCLYVMKLTSSFLFKYFMSGFELILMLWYFFFSRNILHVIFYKLILIYKIFFMCEDKEFCQICLL